MIDNWSQLLKKSSKTLRVVHCRNFLLNFQQHSNSTF